METLVVALLAFAIGGCAGFLLLRKLPRRVQSANVPLDAQLILERIEKVFKVVLDRKSVV